ncbi:phenylalanyl-tRNA synthetase, beta subunit [Bernardetia litoralis DSM 6794]|uniref:Phenylalanine--tRNA ligase beta subunit n=1 Tax=Bernardetia litoralis (strain ATCC 23117 / DSM 6794 / NBRC 15988 / NCIMB 1366 / Fx l1 / Sio-4) TaxID=880071 RepID=I4AF75_BERLS|nr:phenylalanine--tRNA ligase subunit beta [Bernardetia litoralis]AFM02610.1 phenylalanyl-tRNA synthetase, beta subunit [Bernardetia litoralis DSM 6794]
MNISLSWLKKYIQLEESAEKIAEYLTETGLEVEGIETFEQIKGGLEGFVVGEVLTCEPHTNSDHLNCTTVDIGVEENLSIVCGAENVAKGQKVIVATIGTMLYPEEGEPFKIKKGKIRGEVSQGMICAEDELGLGKGHDGILVLEGEKAQAKNGTPASKIFDLQNDTVLEIGLTPNRVDAASHYGTARDLKARLKREISIPSVDKFDTLKKEINKTDAVQVEIKNAEACPRYSGITIKNVKVSDSPAWLKMALESIGQKSINNVVDITNYVLHSFGQPLHAFDADKVKGNKIVVSTLEKGKEFVALDKETYKLAESDLVICDSELNPLCIAGVFGGADSGVSDSTTNIFLESAYFSPDFVRKTSKIHDLFTDASFRFARGTDPNNTLHPLKYAALLIQEIAGTEKTIFSEVTDLYPQEIEIPSFEVSYNYLNRLIGNDIPKETVKQILTDLDIKISNETEDTIIVSVPTYRVDVLKPADIAEEVLRIYGLNNIEFPQTAATDYIAPSISKDQEIRKKTADILVGMGFSEMMNNSLTSSNYAKALGIESSSVKMLNPLSVDLDVMRQSLLFGGLESITRNLNRQEELIKGFEFGKVYSKIEEPKDEQHKYFEEWQLGILLAGQTPTSWNAKATPVDYFQLSSVVQRIMRAVGFDVADFDQSKLSEDNELQYGIELTKRTGRDSSQQILKMGLVKKKLCKLTDTNTDVFFAQIRWEVLLGLKIKPREFSALSKFPIVRRDLSIVLDKKVSFADVQKIAQKTERKILQNVSVFDIYEGDKMEEGKKSYSVAFSLQDTNKTLDEKTIEKTMQRLISAYEKEGALIRK